MQVAAAQRTPLSPYLLSTRPPSLLSSSRAYLQEPAPAPVPTGQCPSWSSCQAVTLLPAQASPEVAVGPPSGSTFHSAAGPCWESLTSVPHGACASKGSKGRDILGFGSAWSPKSTTAPFLHFFSLHLMSGSLWIFYL